MIRQTTLGFISTLVLGLAFGSQAQAASNQFNNGRNAKFAAMNAIANALPLNFYEGITPDGAPCTLTIARTPWVLGQSFQSILISGSKYLTPPFPGNLWGTQGFFQINLSDALFLTEANWNANQLTIGTEFSPDYAVPNMTFGETWNGELTVTKFPGGGVASVAIIETQTDRISGFTQTRQFVCGARQPQ